MDLGTHKFHISRDIVFHEQIFPFVVSSKEQHRSLFQTASQLTTDDEMHHIHDQHAVESSTHHVVQPNPARPVKEHRRPSYLQDFVCCSSASHNMSYCYQFVHFSHQCTDFHCSQHFSSAHSEPKSYAEAINDPSWQATMEKEITTLLSNDTWTVVSLPVEIHPF